MIDLIDVSKSYGQGLPAVNHANLHVDKGEFVFIVKQRFRQIHFDQASSQGTGFHIRYYDRKR